MPRVMDLSDELEVLTKALQEDPKLLRQYVLRLPVAYAIKFVCDCIEQDKQPAHLLRDIVLDHYDGVDREQVLLSPYANKLIAAVCRETQQTPDEAVNTLITALAPKYLQEVAKFREAVG